jgi:hypothetical protein
VNARTWLSAVAVLCATWGARGQETDATLLARYLKPGVEPSAVRFDPDYPSEREVLTAVARKLPRSLDPTYDMNRTLPVQEVRMELPVMVRIFSRVPPENHGFYYYLVPVTHPHDGVVLAMVYDRRHEKQSNALIFDIGIEWRPTLNQRSPIYLIRADEARRLVERQFAVVVTHAPMASSVPDSKLGVGRQSGGDWFWYVRSDEGFQTDGRTIHSILVYPFAKVQDASSVTEEFLRDDSSAVGAGHVLLKHRFYTFGDEEVDLYALDEAQRRAGNVALSSDRASSLYLPARPNLVPLRLAEPAGPDE